MTRAIMPAIVGALGVLPLHAEAILNDRGAAATNRAADSWELSLESGYLWGIELSHQVGYEVAPTQFSLRTPSHWTLWEDDAGGRMVVRGRFGLLLYSIVEGPEDHHFGLTAAPSLEYWFPSERTSLFLAPGGGIGWTNSTRIYGGQSQDFTFNWFVQLGLRQALTEDLSLLVAGCYIHHSNGGLSEPNPGLDALGLTVGIGWHF